MTTPATMRAMQLTGHGGPERLDWREDVPVPAPGPGEVLIAVAASTVNNTDINTRIGWYAKSVTGATGEDATSEDGSWTGRPLAFPLIQGADCAGRIVATGEGVDPAREGARVIVRALQTRPGPEGRPETYTFGSECDGAFADYAVARDADSIAVDSPWEDAELAALPCAYGTALTMLARGDIGAERVLVTGASGGVGVAVVQLAALRGAEVTAVTAPAKAEAVRALGASETLGRDDPIPKGAFDAVIDLVGGPRFPDLIDALRPGGRYVVSGAIAGPLVELDLRTLYLADLDLRGSTLQPEHVVPDLADLAGRDAFRPPIAARYPLERLREAQAAFLEKSHVGKIAIDVASPGGPA